jgi:hypothetical protein
MSWCDPVAVVPPVGECGRAGVSRWSALLDVRPGRPGPAVPGSSVAGVVAIPEPEAPAGGVWVLTDKGWCGQPARRRPKARARRRAGAGAE